MLVLVLIYIYTLCMRAAKAMRNVRICADSFGPSLLDNAISAKISSADSFSVSLSGSKTATKKRSMIGIQD